MKTGIRGHDVEANGIVNIAAACKMRDIEYIQLVLEKSIDDFKFGGFSEEYAQGIKKELGDRRIAILGSYINPSNPDSEALRGELDKFKEKIRYASVLNPIAVGTETGTYKEGLTHSEEAYQYLLKSIKELAEEGERYNVNVAVEGVHCFVINTPEKLKRLIDDINLPNVRAIFDPVNYITPDNYTNQDEIIKTAFSLLSDRLCAIHAKDFVMEKGEMKQVLPGEGELNWRLILEKMKEYNVDVPIICEGYTDREAQKAFENLKKIN